MAFPTGIKFSNVELNTVQPVQITKSLSGREERNILSSQYWTLTANFSNLSDADRKLLMGFYSAQSGGLNAFNLQLPDPLGDSSAGFTGTITLSGTEAIGQTEIGVTTSELSSTILKSGDLVRFSGHNKVYMVTSDVTTDGTGAANIDIFPALQVEETNTTTISHTDVNITVRFPENLSFAMGPELFGSFSITFTEVI